MPENKPDKPRDAVHAERLTLSEHAENERLSTAPPLYAADELTRLTVGLSWDFVPIRASVWKLRTFDAHAAVKRL